MVCFHLKCHHLVAVLVMPASAGKTICVVRQGVSDMLLRTTNSKRNIRRLLSPTEGC